MKQQTKTFGRDRFLLLSIIIRRLADVLTVSSVHVPSFHYMYVFYVSSSSVREVVTKAK
jgi:hypothetical protein